MDRDELAAWLRLTLTPGIGNGGARRLLAAFGLPQNIFAQSQSALRQTVTAPQAAALAEEPPELPALLQATWQWLHTAPEAAGADQGIRRHILTLGDAAYPASLLATEDPPLMLYLLGQTARLPADGHWPARALAMVGSRSPTPQGAQNARAFARAFSQAGLSVISGLALGIDGAAHEGALDACEQLPPGSHLATLAVIGTGIDRVYPRRHHALAHRIAQHGLILSEYPLGTPPLPANFPKRNRLIAGLSQGTLVVEAALQSGSLITARLTVEQGKDVFAIPGSIHSPQSRGAHALIRQGAKLVETAQDVLEELRWPAHLRPPTETPEAEPAPSAPAAKPAKASQAAKASKARPKTQAQAPEADPTPTASAPPVHPGDADSAALLQALGADPASLDTLQARTGLDTPTLQARLLTLELEGQVARLPGGLFQRLMQA